jgi:hypothetical protein
LERLNSVSEDYCEETGPERGEEPPKGTGEVKNIFFI